MENAQVGYAGSLDVLSARVPMSLSITDEDLAAYRARHSPKKPEQRAKPPQT
jgi:hypothetical protein